MFGLIKQTLLKALLPIFLTWFVQNNLILTSILGWVNEGEAGIVIFCEIISLNSLIPFEDRVNIFSEGSTNVVSGIYYLLYGRIF